MSGRILVLGAAPAKDESLPLAEHELTSLWLLGRVPANVLPWPLLRAGRAGTGPGPDVREAAFALPEGVTRSGDVEVHLRASDFRAHGHDRDAAYDGIALHLVWHEPRPGEIKAAGLSVPTVAVGPALGHSPARLRRLLALGPSGCEPCGGCAAERGVEETARLVRLEGRRRLAERVWRAAALVAERGWDEAWAILLERALRSSAGRHRETPARRAALASVITQGLGDEPLRGLAERSEDHGALVDVLRGHQSLGVARASEVGWNAALPLLMALAAAYDDEALARRTARLADGWPAPRPYGRTRALASLLTESSDGPPGGPAARRGALWAQGLLRMQDLWCTRGGCGVCPLSTGGGDGERMGPRLATARPKAN